MAADKLNLDEGMKQILSQPKRELTVTSPCAWMMEVIRSLPAIACSTRSPVAPRRAAFAITRTSRLDEVKALAMWMTWKCATVAFPTAEPRAA